MAAQFESIKFSGMVMTTIPFSLIGAFGLLWLTDCSISMVSLIGFLMLIGTVVNNGILFVDTANQYRGTMNRDTALIEAGATRIRPILKRDPDSQGTGRRSGDTWNCILFVPAQ